jgi:hypothetical protein
MLRSASRESAPAASMRGGGSSGPDAVPSTRRPRRPVDRRPPASRAPAARAVYALYGAAGSLQQLSPEAFAHFGPEHQALAIGWLKQRRAGDVLAAS